MARGATRAISIVAIGASAGGLEAIEQFLRHVAVSSGLAYFIVQHLDPTQPGSLPQLLQRATTMPAAQVKDRMRLCALPWRTAQELQLLFDELLIGVTGFFRDPAAWALSAAAQRRTT